jgi:hypothetical protein
LGISLEKRDISSKWLNYCTENPKILLYGNVMNKRLGEDFSELTIRALSEKDVDKLIEYLMERDNTYDDLGIHNIDLTPEELKEFLSREEKVVERLEEERKKVLQQMDQLSKSKKAAKTYSSKFPFPAMPVFLDETG